MILLVLRALAGPEDLAPGAPELLAAEAQLEALLVTARATAEATSRLQTAWTTLPTPKEVCGAADTQARADAAKTPEVRAAEAKAQEARPDPADAPPEPSEDPALTRLEIGWRIERFGSAWREATQAVRAQAERVRRYRGSATVAPLVDTRWNATLDRLLTEAGSNERAFLEASAWQVSYVRPTLAACPAQTPTARSGVPMLTPRVRGEERPQIAVLALGDGWVCSPSSSRGARADDAVVLVTEDACWSASPTCGCNPTPVEPGAILGVR